MFYFVVLKKLKRLPELCKNVKFLFLDFEIF